MGLVAKLTAVFPFALQGGVFAAAAVALLYFFQEKLVRLAAAAADNRAWAPIPVLRSLRRTDPHQPPPAPTQLYVPRLPGVPEHDERLVPDKWGFDAEDVWFTSADGTKLHGWLLTMRGWTRDYVAGRPVLMFFQENAGARPGGGGGGLRGCRMAGRASEAEGSSHGGGRLRQPRSGAWGASAGFTPRGGRQPVAAAAAPVPALQATCRTGCPS